MKTQTHPIDLAKRVLLSDVVVAEPEARALYGTTTWVLDCAKARTVLSVSDEDMEEALAFLEARVQRLNET